jgi:Tol biopolymer transport system component
LTRRTIYFPEEHGFLIFPEVRDYAFSPDGERLIILYDIYSEQFEKSMRFQTYLMDLPTGMLYDSGSLKNGSASLSPRVVWSPDGNKLLYFLTDTPSRDQYLLNIYQSDLLTGEKLVLYDPSMMSNTDYFYITNIYWR